MLRCLSAGESHGKAIMAILEGMPAGLRIDAVFINKELKRRQAGFGRGRRMRIEKDRCQILAGLKNNLTLGSPIALLIPNKDAGIERLPKVFLPRPGHADLSGLLTYGFSDIRNVLERASARSTVATVGIGALCKILLAQFKIEVSSRVLSIAGEVTKAGMREKIKEAIKNKDSVGGIFEVRAVGVPAGLGSYVQSDRRLDARLSQCIMAIPGIKAVEIGLGLGYSVSFGSEVHDAIYYNIGKNIGRGYSRKTNNAGGIEGGISNGEDLVIRGCMKPISTLLRPLASVNIATKKSAKATVERTDTCVVEAAGVVAEAASAFVVADALLEKFGSDNLLDIKKAYQDYSRRL